MPLNKDQVCSSKAGSRSAGHHLQIGFLCTTFVFNVPKQTAITQPLLGKQPVNLTTGQKPINKQRGCKNEQVSK